MNLFVTDGWMDSSNQMVARGERPRIEILSLERDKTKGQKGFLPASTTHRVGDDGIHRRNRRSQPFPVGCCPQGSFGCGFSPKINTAGVTFLFRYKNIVVAILGVLVGAAAALVIEMEQPGIRLRHLYNVLHDCLGGFGLRGDAAPVLRNEHGTTKKARVVWEN